MTEPVTRKPEPSPSVPQGGRIPEWLIETPYWAISAVVHVILLLLIGGIVLLRAEAEAEPVEMSVSVIEPPPRPPEPPRPPDLDSRPESEETERDRPKLRPAPIPPSFPTIEPPTPEPPPLDPTAAMGLVAGPQSYELPAIFDGRSRRGPKGGGGRGGPAAEAAVLAALKWLVRHQHADGHWSAQDYFERCDASSGPCKMQHDWHHEGAGLAEFDVGVTALALMAFLGDGHTHQHSLYPDFRDAVHRAMNWLLDQQVLRGGDRQRGRLGPDQSEQWVYNHSIATLALAELLAMTRDRFRLSHPVQQATALCLRSQNQGYGWKYGYRDGHNDTSVTGWMVLALKASRLCAQLRLIKFRTSHFDAPLTDALNWFDRTTSRNSGRTGYTAPGDPGSQLRGSYPEPYPFDKDLSCMTAVSVLCRIFAGQGRRHDAVEKGIAVLEAEPPDWRPARGKRRSKINMYYWYYATYALFQFGGRPWREWNEALLEAVIPSQRREGCEHGSWDPLGEWGAAGGRVYATAINAMTLEVYYRFRRIQQSSPK